MKRALVDPKICQNCTVCGVETKCPTKAVIREDEKEMPWIDFYKCRGCMKCKQFCEIGAILEELKPCNGSFASTW